MTIRFNENEYTLPDGWKDVTFRKFLASQKVIQGLSPELEALFFQGKQSTEDISIELIEFQRQWVGFWLDVEFGDEILIHDDGDSWGLSTIFGYLHEFMYFPKEGVDVVEFEFQGVKYSRLGEDETLMGGKLPMGKSTYGQFVESAQMARYAGKLNNGNLEALLYLVAILYSQKYEESRIRKMVAIFQDLGMDIVFSSAFFLILSCNSSVRHLSRYLPERAVEILSTTGI